MTKYKLYETTDTKLEGCSVNLTKEQHKLLYEIMIEFRKHIHSKLIQNDDRYAAIYLKQAYIDFIQLCKTLNVYEEWMDDYV